MFSEELMSLLLKVISSWQVIAITVFIALYIYLVSFVAQVYRRSRFSSLSPRRWKKKDNSAGSMPHASGQSDDEINDELGLGD